MRTVVGKLCGHKLAKKMSKNSRNLYEVQREKKYAEIWINVEKMILTFLH